MGDPGFVWVNKTSRSTLLTRSDGEERRRILSRAQKGRPSASESFVVVTASSVRSRHAEQATRSGKRLRYNHNDEKKRHPGSPFREVAQSDLDPFQTFCVIMDKDMQNMFTYYTNSVIALIFPVASVAALARQHIVAHAAKDPAVLYALVGASNAIVFASSQSDKHAWKSAQFGHQALVNIRETLSQGTMISATTAFAIAQLLRIECGQGDKATVQIHYTGLVNIMGMIGSTSDVPFSIRLSVQASLNNCAAMLETSPPVVAPGCGYEGEDGGFPSQIASIQYIKSLARSEQTFASRFASQPYREFVGEVLLDIITDSRVLDLAKERAIREGPQLSFDQIQVLTSAPLSVEHRLLRMPFHESTAVSCTPARNVVRLALYILSGPPVPIPQPRHPFRTSLARQLKLALQQSNISELWRPCSDLLLWALFVAAYVSDQQIEWPWIITQAALVCKELDINSLSAFQNTLIAFDLALGRFADFPQKMWLSIQTSGVQSHVCDEEMA